MVATRRGARTGADAERSPTQKTKASSNSHTTQCKAARHAQRNEDEDSSQQQPSQASASQQNDIPQASRKSKSAIENRQHSHSTEPPLPDPPIRILRGSTRVKRAHVITQDEDVADTLHARSVRRKEVGVEAASNDDAVAKVAQHTQEEKPFGRTTRAKKSAGLKEVVALDDPSETRVLRARNKHTRHDETENMPILATQSLSTPDTRGGRNLRSQDNNTGQSVLSHTKHSPAVPRKVVKLGRAAKDEDGVTVTRASRKLQKKEPISKATAPSPAQGPRRALKSRPRSPDTDISMSSRPTTPSLSPAPLFEQPKDLSEDRAESQAALEELDNEDESDAGDPTENDAHGRVESEDELAGPKTPMRRSRRRNARTLRNVSEKLYDRSPTRQQRHRRTRTGQNIAETELAASISLPPPSNGVFEEPRADMDDSLFNEDTLFPQIEEDAAQPELATLDIDAAVLAHAGDFKIETEQDAEETIVVEEDNTSIASSSSETNVVEHAEEVDNALAPSQSEPHSHEALDAQDTADDDLDDDADYTQLSLNPKTPRPETINWYHVQPNTALRHALDLGLSPNVDHSHMGILPDVATSTPSKPHVEAGTIHQQDDEDDVDQTVNFTDFVSVSGVMQSTPAQAEAQSGRVDSQHEGNHEKLPRSSLDPEDNITLENVHDDGVVATRTASLEPNPSPKVAQEITPHYMMTTLASDARRKTLPAKSLYTPVKSSARPNTSNGAEAWSTGHEVEVEESERPRPQSQASSRFTGAASASADGRLRLAPFSTTTPSRANITFSTPSKPRPSTKLETVGARVPHTVAGYSRTVKNATNTPMRESLRRIVLHDGRINIARSPIRTPLRSITGATSVATMTPHPAMPLRGVLAIVEVYTCEGASASAPFVALLLRLGAKTTKIWSDRVTHVIFKDGSPATLQRVALHNKRALRSGSGAHIHCVNSRWVSDCDAQSTRVMEADEAYMVSTEGFAGSAKRKRKSMEPMPMVNVDGHLIRDRKSSWGRDSASRYLSSATPSRSASPAQLPASVFHKSVDASASTATLATASPATPAWIAAPHRLVQATAPVKKIRRLAPVGGMKLSARRLTDLDLGNASRAG